jgi:hypothetical protein
LNDTVKSASYCVPLTKLLVDSSLDFWLITGRFAQTFEKQFARFIGLRSAVLVNSGSSANLLALTCLTSPKLGDRRLQAGDEVITVATGFRRLPGTKNGAAEKRAGFCARSSKAFRMTWRCACRAIWTACRHISVKWPLVVAAVQKTGQLKPVRRSFAPEHPS